jgi:hypothetical protein
MICPCQAREAIPQPAGLAELVFGDQGKSSDAQWIVPLANLFPFVFFRFFTHHLKSSETEAQSLVSLTRNV